MKPEIRGVYLVGMVAVLLSANGFAQGTGTIHGTVTDITLLPIPKAIIKPSPATATGRRLPFPDHVRTRISFCSMVRSSTPSSVTPA